MSYMGLALPVEVIGSSYAASGLSIPMYIKSITDAPLALTGTTATFTMGSNANTSGSATALLRASRTAAFRVYADDGGAVLWGVGSVPDLRAGLSRTLVTTSQAGGFVRLWGHMGYLTAYNASVSSEQVGGLNGRLELWQAAAGTVAFAGYGVSAGVVGTLATVGTTSVGSTAVVAGLAAMADLRGTFTQTGKAVGLYVGKYDTTNWSDATSRAKFGYGIYVDAASVTNGFQFGASASSDGSGVSLAGSARPFSLYADTATTSLTTDTRTFLVRTLIGTTQTSSQTLSSIRAQLKVKSAVDLQAGFWHAIRGYVEVEGATSLTNTLMCLSALEGYFGLSGTVTIGANAVVAGVKAIIANEAAGAFSGSGIAAAFYVASGTPYWTYGLYIPAGCATQAIGLGTSAAPLALVASTPHVAMYTTSASTSGEIVGAQITQTMTAVSTGAYVEGLKVSLNSAVKLGNPCAIYGIIDFKTAGFAHGATSVIQGELIFPSTDVVIRGTYPVFSAEIGCPAAFKANGNPIIGFALDAYGDGKTEFDTAGYLISLAGVTPAIGKFLSANSQTARCLTATGVTRYMVLSRIEDGLGLGVTGTPMTLVASSPFFSMFTTSAATSGETYTALINHVNTGVSSGGYYETLKVRFESAVKVGNPCAIYGIIDFKTAGLAHGATSVIQGELIFPSTDVVVRGTYPVFTAEIGCPSGLNMHGNPIIGFAVDAYDTGKTEFDTNGYMFSLSGITAGGGKVYDETGTTMTADSTLRILINGVPKYLLVRDAAS